MRGPGMIMLVTLLIVGVSAAPLYAQALDPPEIRLLTIDGVINPLSARYLERELENAAAADVTAVVLRLDTPGGLETSLRGMIEAILGSRVPVVAYVAPPGARAASAGMFLVLAAHVAAMAPGTNIGAAHPVTLGSQQPDTTLAQKMVSDAAALARALAERHGRNAEWAELAVRRSISITAAEAVKANVVEFVADDRNALLARLNGRSVQTRAGTVVMRVAGARVIERPMSLPERIVHAITDPNIAYLLFMIGFIGIIAELYNPGMIFPGVTGLVSLIMAFVAFGSLPVNWAGVALLVLGLALFVGDLMIEGIG
ncbi:MAG: NfeD family protein, partial [Gemmatimonadota bacterium]